MQVRLKDRRWHQADGMRRQWYLSTWRLAPFGRFWQLDTRLDTPPSINRRHLDFRLARASVTV